MGIVPTRCRAGRLSTAHSAWLRQFGDQFEHRLGNADGIDCQTERHIGWRRAVLKQGMVGERLADSEEYRIMRHASCKQTYRVIVT